jgi:hypothetical protein
MKKQMDSDKIKPTKQEQHQQKQRVREHSNFYKNKNYKNTRTVQPKTNMKKQIDSNTTKPK